MPSSPHLSLRESSETASHNKQTAEIPSVMAQSAGVPQRLRNDESWVEISSQPSSSSLSSIGDEIVTTGLRVDQEHHSRRRRRIQPQLPGHVNLEHRHTGTSSQEEYDESESDEDHILTSSNEHIPTRLSAVTKVDYDAGSDCDSNDDDDDENATALGQPTNTRGTPFTPQPNAFSHPPSSQSRSASQGSYFPTQRPAYPSRNPSRSHQSPYPRAADHDAALRASLTTLLSIGAAAARGLPKREDSGIAPARTAAEPMGLHFIPESELGVPFPNTGRPLSPSTRARSSPSISSQEALEAGKRKASTTKPGGEKARALKKKRMQAVEEETMISPTLLGWVYSAGVVVLVSVVGFGAGYVIGREVGRQEAMDFTAAGWNGSLGEGSGSCGKEVARGSLRRFRWNLSGGKSVVVR